METGKNMEMEKFSSLVVLPTYNEAESIAEVLDALSRIQGGIDVLVVDDSSPDKTADIVTNHPKYNENVFLLLRPKRKGLGTAYKEGFHWGLQRNYDIFFEMDSDLSHNPEDITRFIEAIEKGADLVIGSRYLQGISVVNWPLFRLCISMGAGIYVRIFTGLCLTDPTSGFKAIHRNVLEKMDWDKIVSNGYGFQVELNFFASRMGFGLLEIPIIFTERRNGKSKFSSAIIFEAAVRVLHLGMLRFFPRD